MPYRFSDCIFDIECAELLHAGKPIRLRPIAFKLLHYLIEQRDHAVSKQELFDHIWPNRIVSDATLSSSIKEVRQAIGDNGTSQAMLQTLHGYGYRFIATIIDAHDQPSSCTVAQLQVSKPFIGRQKPWQALLDAWHNAEQGYPHMLAVTGEAGIGKTRLAEALLDHLAQQDISIASACAYAMETTAYGPVSEWLRAESIKRRLALLENTWLSDIARLLPELLVERSDLVLPQPLSESWQRRQFFEALARAVLATEQPLLLFLDDLQWCDQDTLKWLHYLLRFDINAKLLIVTTLRNEELADNPALSSLFFELQKLDRLTEIELMPFDADETAALATHVMNYSPTQEQLDRLYRITTGHPLFIVEMSRLQLESELPPKIQAVITARLAQLSDHAKQLIGLAAAIGRRFTLNFLISASGEVEQNVVQALEELWRKRIIRESEGGYDFSHDLIRKVAYGAVSPIKKQLYHRQIADVLENQSTIEIGTTPLAIHNMQAGRWAKAANFYGQAALHARQISTHKEEVDGLENALGTYDKLPQSIDNQRRQINLWLDLGLVRSATVAWGNPSVGTVWKHAYKLALQAGSPFQQGCALNALDFAIQTHNRYCHIQLLTIKGDCLLNRDPIEAEKAYQLAIAKKRGARSLELRTTIGLCVLWQQSGKCQQAYDCLAKIHAEFDEGLATADLQHAKALLSTLVHNIRQSSAKVREISAL